MKSFEVLIYQGDAELDEYNDNVDVEVIMKNGDRYSATFFTIQNIKTMFEKNKQTGECHSGLFFWATDMLIVEKLNLETIETSINELIGEGSIAHAMTKLD